MVEVLDLEVMQLIKAFDDKEKKEKFFVFNGTEWQEINENKYVFLLEGRKNGK